MPNDYIYIRVSSREQNVARQLDAFLSLDIPSENIFIDRQSGKDFNRPEYIRLLKRLQEGDTLFVKSIDRLGRNYTEILENWRTITKLKRADIVILDMQLLDTRQKGRDLTGTFIADLVLQLLSDVAETERELIKQRQSEGIASAKIRGVKFGRPCKPKPENYPEVLAQYRSWQLTPAEAARACGVAYHTFLKWAESENRSED
jgi:DNA invertase Pin-like site-specific DNA recombinase